MTVSSETYAQSCNVSITFLSFAFIVEMRFKDCRWWPNLRVRTIQAIALAVAKPGPQVKVTVNVEGCRAVLVV